MQAELDKLLLNTLVVSSQVLVASAKRTGEAEKHKTPRRDKRTKRDQVAEKGLSEEELAELAADPEAAADAHDNDDLPDRSPSRSGASSPSSRG